MKILVAEDSKTNLLLISTSLKNMGHTVIEAKSGEETIKYFKTNFPDLIILDVIMGGIDGFETAKRIRKITTEWIPIIFLSAEVDDESLVQGIEAGGDDYLTKPISNITLEAKIKAMQRIADMRQHLIRLTNQLRLLSSTDPLTGLYNRLQFEKSIREKIAFAKRQNESVFLLFMDLDHFKLVNDSLGHQVGDWLLKQVSYRLKGILREYDLIARLGGDEFAIIITDGQLETVNFIAQKIIDELTIPFHYGEHPLQLSASIGIASFPELADDRQSLIQNADIAMYHAKSIGRNNYQFFTEEIFDQHQRIIQIDNALKFALERNEMKMLYQPVFMLKTKSIIAIEAILNWTHNKLGTIPPNVFIPLAEENGLIKILNQWSLKEACRDAGIWLKNKSSVFKLSVNVSSRFLNQVSIGNLLKNIINEVGFPLHQLELELHENTVMKNPEVFKKILDDLSQIGFQLSMNNFGIGYSSFINLANCPINQLKIAENLIQGIESGVNERIIVKSLICLSQNLGIKICAAGIETQKELDFLIESNCPLGQGNYLCKPLSASEMNNFLKNYAISVIS